MIDIHRPNHHVSTFVAIRDRIRSLAATASGLGVGRIDRDLGVRFGFIVGCGHSGTSLLASRLGLHAEAWLVDGESYAFSPIHSARRCRCAVREWAHAARSVGRSLVLEKTPKHVHSLARLNSMLPDAAIIATARHPLENIASMAERFGSLGLAIERWSLDHAAVAQAVESSKAHLVRFEDLTTDPATTLCEAAAHLGLGWDAGMLEAGRTGYRAPTNLMARRLHEVTQPIQHRVERWRGILSDADAKAVIAATSSIARRLGYSARPPTGGTARGCDTVP